MSTISQLRYPRAYKVTILPVRITPIPTSVQRWIDMSENTPEMKSQFNSRPVSPNVKSTELTGDRSSPILAISPSPLNINSEDTSITSTANVSSGGAAATSSVTTTTLPTTSSLATVLGLTANQIDLIVKNIGEVFGNATGSEVLTKLPTAVLTTYQAVAKFSQASVTTQQQMVLNLLVQGIEQLGLSEPEIVLLEPVIQMLVPALITELPKIESGVYQLVQEVEAEALSCWGKFCAIL